MKYKVLSPIKTGFAADELLQPGDTIDVTGKAAAELIACGAIEDPKAKAKSADDSQSQA